MQGIGSAAPLLSSQAGKIWKLSARVPISPHNRLTKNKKTEAVQRKVRTLQINEPLDKPKSETKANQINEAQKWLIDTSGAKFKLDILSRARIYI